jgi:hypothetical protein
MAHGNEKPAGRGGLFIFFLSKDRYFFSRSKSPNNK